MNTPIVISQVLGIVFAVMGLSVLVNRKSIIAFVEESIAHFGFLWLTGFMTLIIGAVLVALNDSWGSGLQSVITIIGWLAVIKGLFIMIFPNAAISLYRNLNRKSLLSIAGIIALIIGLIFLFKGFM